MNIVNRVLVIVFIVSTMLAAAIVFAVTMEFMDPKTILADPWHMVLEPFRDLDSEAGGVMIGICLGVMCLGLLALAIELYLPWGPPKMFLLTQGPLGRVMVARSGIEELVDREIQGVDGVLEARALVNRRGAGFQITGRVAVSPTTKVSELAKEVQQRVKAVVESHLGSQVSEVRVQTQLSPLSNRRQRSGRVR